MQVTADEVREMDKEKEKAAMWNGKGRPSADMERDSVTGSNTAEPKPAKKVTIFVGSPQKRGATYAAARRFLDGLESFGDVRGEIVALDDYKIGVCRGCKICFLRGEERCPLRDDRDILIEKMANSDAVVFASPNYSFQVPAVMKIFLDRLGFAFHRPAFHGKTSTSIVVQGIYGGRKIASYLGFVAGGLGFNVVKGSCVRTLEPMTRKASDRMQKTIDGHVRRFHARLLRPAYEVPSLAGLMKFRMSRMSIKQMLGEQYRDYEYYRERGWFEADYYYPTRLGTLKKISGAIFDWAGARMFRPQPELK